MIDKIFSVIDPLGVVNQAYDKDFRWWFLALLVCVMSLGLWALKYLLSRSEVEATAHSAQVAALVTELSSSRENHHNKMEGMQSRAFDVIREVTAIIASCNKVIEINTLQAEKVRIVLDRLGNK